MLAGNKLKQLPEEIGQFKSLRKLQLAGNQLTSLPHVICTMTQLQVQEALLISVKRVFFRLAYKLLAHDCISNLPLLFPSPPAIRFEVGVAITGSLFLDLLVIGRQQQDQELVRSCKQVFPGLPWHTWQAKARAVCSLYAFGDEYFRSQAAAILPRDGVWGSKNYQIMGTF